MKYNIARGASAPVILLAATAVSAAPPSTSAYLTDAQSSHVQDETSESIGQVNMITCVFHAMRPDALVNQGAYVALIDKNSVMPRRLRVSRVTAPAQAPLRHRTI